MLGNSNMMITDLRRLIVVDPVLPEMLYKTAPKKSYLTSKSAQILWFEILTVLQHTVTGYWFKILYETLQKLNLKKINYNLINLNACPC